MGLSVLVSGIILFATNWNACRLPNNRTPHYMTQTEFIERISPVQHRLFRFALQMTGHRDQAEDVIQEVCIRLWNRRGQLHEIENIEAWCMTITRNLCLDLLKSRHRKLSELPADPDWADSGPEPHRQAELNEDMELIRICLQSLPEKQHVAIHLREVEGMSYQEIANMTGETLTQVKTLIHRGRKAIRDSLLKTHHYGT